jgi:ribosomal protein L11 methylase PrmA
MFFILGLKLIIALVALLAAVTSVAAVATGAPFVVTEDKRIKAMLALAGDVKGKKMVDLGAGDGRIVIAFAQAGADALGYDINPWLVLRANRKIRALKLSNAHMYWRSFWRIDLGEFDVITLYGIPYIMQRLEEKLQRERKPSTVILSNSFRFPTWKIDTEQDGVARYLKQKN